MTPPPLDIHYLYVRAHVRQVLRPALEAPLNVAQMFGERVREMQRARKLTQVQVAERTGMLQHHISRLENGEVMPMLETILKVAAVIGCKPTDSSRPLTESTSKRRSTSDAAKRAETSAKASKKRR